MQSRAKNFKLSHYPNAGSTAPAQHSDFGARPDISPGLTR